MITTTVPGKNLDKLVPNGGFDRKTFVNQEISDRLICGICFNVLKNPLQCRSEKGKKAHTYCKECFERTLALRPNCPSCSLPMTADELEYSARKEEIDERLAYCYTTVFSTGSDDTCNWQGAFEDMECHLQIDCQFMAVSCYNSQAGCLKVLQRRHQKEHAENCPYRPVQCADCLIFLSFKDLFEVHSARCDKRQVSCPNECDDRVTAESLELHLESCRFRFVSCRLFALGAECCTGSMRHCDIEEHQSTAAFLSRAFLVTSEKSARIIEQQAETIADLQAVNREYARQIQTFEAFMPLLQMVDNERAKERERILRKREKKPNSYCHPIAFTFSHQGHKCMFPEGCPEKSPHRRTRSAEARWSCCDRLCSLQDPVCPSNYPSNHTGHDMYPCCRSTNFDAPGCTYQCCQRKVTHAHRSSCPWRPSIVLGEDVGDDNDFEDLP